MHCSPWVSQRSHRTSAVPRVQRRRAFTLVEVVVATLLVMVGLLAYAGGTAAAVRTADEARRSRAVSERAANRVEMLAASGCSPTSGTAYDTLLSADERWSLTRDPDGVMHSHVELRWRTRRGVRTRRVDRVFAC